MDGLHRRGAPATLWDWLGLLVIPLALAGLGFALNAAQTERDFTHGRGGESFRASPRIDRAREGEACVRGVGNTMVG